VETRRALFAYLAYLLIGIVTSALLVALSQPIQRLFAPISGGVHSPRFWLAIAISVIAWGALFGLLHRLPSRAKKRLIVIVTFVSGLFWVLEFFLPAHSAVLFFWRPAHGNPFTPLKQPVGYALQVIAGFTFFLASLNLMRLHAGHLARLRAGWYNSLAFFVAFFAMAAFGLWAYYDGKNPVAIRWNTWLFTDMYVPLTGTMFSVTAFYMATAAFRAFRIRTAEAGVMMLAAVVVMVGQVPLGMWFTSSLPLQGPASNLRIEVIANWLLGVVNSAALRGVLFGLLVGGLAMSLRMWLNLERGAFFDQET